MRISPVRFLRGIAAAVAMIGCVLLLVADSAPDYPASAACIYPAFDQTFDLESTCGEGLVTQIRVTKAQGIYEKAKVQGVSVQAPVEISGALSPRGGIQGAACTAGDTISYDVLDLRIRIGAATVGGNEAGVPLVGSGFVDCTVYLPVRGSPSPCHGSNVGCPQGTASDGPGGADAATCDPVASNRCQVTLRVAP